MNYLYITAKKIKTFHRGKVLVNIIFTSILVHSLTFIDNYQVILKGRGPYLRGRGPVLCIISLKFCHTNSKKYLQKKQI